MMFLSSGVFFRLLQDLADKDDLIGTRSVPLRNIVKQHKEHRIEFLDTNGKGIVKGKDGKNTTVFLRLKGTRAQKTGNILEIAGERTSHLVGRWACPLLRADPRISFPLQERRSHVRVANLYFLKRNVCHLGQACALILCKKRLRQTNINRHKPYFVQIAPGRAVQQLIEQDVGNGCDACWG